MSLNITSQSLDIKLTGKTTYVPDNNLAKLIYYLDCVTSVIQIEEKLPDYREYFLISEEEEKALVTLAILFNPKILIDNSLFLVGEKYVPSGKTNQFYEITNNEFGLHVSSEVIIGGVSRKVMKFMGCLPSWLDKNYYHPLDYYLRTQPKLLEPEKNNCCNCCDSLCFCCFDSCFGCCDCKCSVGCKKACCFTFWVIIIVLLPAIILIIIFKIIK